MADNLKRFGAPAFARRTIAALGPLSPVHRLEQFNLLSQAHSPEKALSLFRALAPAQAASGGRALLTLPAIRARMFFSFTSGHNDAS